MERKENREKREEETLFGAGSHEIGPLHHFLCAAHLALRALPGGYLCRHAGPLECRTCLTCWAHKAAVPTT